MACNIKIGCHKWFQACRLHCCVLTASRPILVVKADLCITTHVSSYHRSCLCDTLPEAPGIGAQGRSLPFATITCKSAILSCSS